jgi:hypothetical protein
MLLGSRTRRLIAGGRRYYERLQTLDALSIHAEIVVAGTWGDYVDTIAGNRIGGLPPKRCAASSIPTRRN